jgi:hypothetical protein
MTYARTPLTVKNGDTFRKTLTVTKDDGTVANLTGATLTFYMGLRHATTPTLTVPLAIADPATGKGTLELTAIQTAALAAGTPYFYEVELISDNGDVSTIVEGVITVTPDLG